MNHRPSSLLMTTLILFLSLSQCLALDPDDPDHRETRALQMRSPYDTFPQMRNALNRERLGSGRNIQAAPCFGGTGVNGERAGLNAREEGVCMFAWNCMEAGGVHVGVCIDRFYFGSCCKMPHERVGGGDDDGDLEGVDDSQTVFEPDDNEIGGGDDDDDGDTDEDDKTTSSSTTPATANSTTTTTTTTKSSTTVAKSTSTTRTTTTATTTTLRTTTTTMTKTTTTTMMTTTTTTKTTTTTTATTSSSSTLLFLFTTPSTTKSTLLFTTTAKVTKPTTATTPTYGDAAATGDTAPAVKPVEPPESPVAPAIKPEEEEGEKKPEEGEEEEEDDGKKEKPDETNVEKEDDGSNEIKESEEKEEETDKETEEEEDDDEKKEGEKDEEGEDEEEDGELEFNEDEDYLHLKKMNYQLACGRRPWFNVPGGLAIYPDGFKNGASEAPIGSGSKDPKPRRRGRRQRRLPPAHAGDKFDSRRRGRIVNGKTADYGEWPWQVSLRQWRTATYLHKCGCALLSENWAITAAHCVENVSPDDLSLRMGEYDLNGEVEPHRFVDRKVQIVASHPKFDPKTFEYDLALLRFYEPVKFSPNIIPICVPEDDEDLVGETAWVTGWGRLYEDGPLPSVMQEVDLPVINNTACEDMYKDAGYVEHIPNIFICAGYAAGGKDSCEGDSGGPMVVQRRDHRFMLAGVISWGIGCAEKNQPGVYTRISYFRDWINQILKF